MAFWRRINRSNLQLLSNQYRRFYFQAPYTSSLHQTRTTPLEKPVSSSIYKKPSYFYNNVRFFAAPVQALKNKKEDPSKDGPRLNEQITAHVVRLVMEDGHHSIVSIHEALDLASKHDLDLVEVQRNDNPPVCRLMDFHQKRYQRRLREKDRAKSKSGETLKKGEGKEVRFTEKICMAMGKGKEDEDEDLGGLLSRLTDLIEDVSVVESGPRVERKQAYVIVRHVKFGPSKKGGGKTSKAVEGATTEPATKSAIDRQRPILPQDDSTESVFKSEDEVLSDEDDLPTSSLMQMQAENVEYKKTAWSVSESGDDLDKLFNNNGGVSSNSTLNKIHATQQRVSSPPNDYASKFLHPKPDVNSTGSNASQFPHPETSIGIDNRHRRSEPRNMFPPARSMEHVGQSTRESIRSEPQFPYPRRQPPQNMGQNLRESARSEPQFPYPQRQPPQSMGQSPQESVRSEPQFPYPRWQPPQNMGQSTRESVRSEPQFSYPLRQPPQNMNASSSVRDTKQVESNDLPKQQPSHSDVSGAPARSFGIFSTPANSSGQQGMAKDAHGSNKGNRYASVRNRDMGGNGANQNFPGSKFDGSRRLEGNVGGQPQRFGISSRDNSNISPNRMPKSN
ncbi:translation initiation factor IF3-1, mitochondrial isoform X2 [Durio zibethinus]|uniref:Translation initiation factor IF3-1, mitochondrial isoform X2 n=1 Tax=Durio zibethinus TaxID=66656 RepID=A0A6P6ADS2_DURZI|nr:translation initiation factor IF3-1, mitochondrial isoform X2 [Durio zibethinus]